MAETTIEEIMSPVHHVNSDIRIDEAIAYMLSKDTGAILIKKIRGKRPNYDKDNFLFQSNIPEFIRRDGQDK